ncbi:alpha/beta hydrolase [Jannaschia ovalis]|uniref:Alpha/beta hydrolase fold domain-containing protein n=1 Tax=Jannaschia ovalis TaxID=3038773 RepID=A0ABY8LCD8_9RHOB|nr:alpha/beta hydrolase fold domain-containing protein [Jannaschia sp. GRR-S6-38]WGH78987.1 alpha/beta hydrolase fold domain-containing protein [Jannaschia sp. GRR-S6-38]
MPFEGRVERADIIRRINAHPLGDTPGRMREAFARLILGDRPDPLPAGVGLLRAAGGLTVQPMPRLASDIAPDIIWFHGGGYVFGAPETHLRPAIHLAAAHGLTVHLPRYRLAPEHRWPAPLEDALAAVGDGPVPVLAGDSAGGHLALVTALELARRGRPAPALLLFSPNTDRTGLNDDRSLMEGLDPMVDDAGDRRLAAMCFGDMPAQHRHVSLLRDDLSLLPPTWIEVGLPEVLRLDSVLLYRMGLEAGAEVHLQETPGLPHMGQLWAPWWPEACASLDRAAEFARDKAAGRVSRAG